MFVLSGKKWKNIYLDYCLVENSVRIDVIAMANLAFSEDLYFKRAFDVRSVFEYVKEIGVRAVLNKVFSRFAEKNRNEKFYSIGIGIVLEANTDRFTKSEPIVFVAPVFPKASERLVLPAFLVKKTSEELLQKYLKPNKLFLYEEADEKFVLPELYGWQPESGMEIDKERVADYLYSVEKFWETNTRSHIKALNLPKKKSVCTEKMLEFPPETSCVNAALYGLGNYAKTQILPNLDDKIRIKEIHEIDPTQIGDPRKYDCNVTTNPEFSSSRDCNVFFIAGYHHTHAELAIKAIEGGCVAVSEKPAVTNHEQLIQLLSLEERFPGKFFTCYHMRYNPLFERATRDLNLNEGDPVHVTADVFEVPLPKYHWYRWPNSKSHIVSNGCHWIDHFLFMNAYSEPVKVNLELMGNGDSVSLVELKNGACLCLHLTHSGSPRIGVQDCVVMRAGDNTVTVVNGSEYKFEDKVCLRKRLSYNRMGAYKEMYKRISAAVVKGCEGDSYKMIKFTNEVMLALDAIYIEKLREIHE